MTIGMLTSLGEWLRALSLSGGGGNAAAWGIVLALAALPALGLLWKKRCRYDWLLLLAAGEILAGLFFLVNPTLLVAEYDARLFISWAASGCVGATLLAWAVLRGLKNILAAESPGRTTERLLWWSSWLPAFLATVAQGINVWQEIRRVTESNTALDTGVLMPTYLTLGVLAIMDLIPTLLCCQVLRWGGKLGLALEEDPFGEETVALAEELGGQGVRMAAVSVGICVVGNLLQFFLLPVLHSAQFSVSFPFASVLLAVVLGLLCRYFRRAKEVSDDNESII